MKASPSHTVLAALLASLVITACKSPEPVQNTASSLMLPPIAQAFECLPKEAAFLAAHRGTSLNKGLAENSMGGQIALIKAGFYFSEIDVAGLKDGTLILMHDGVFDRTTIKTGPVASASWQDVNSLLLRDTDGQITTDTLPKFTDILQSAKGKIYLEVDFKSSARFEDVIASIRQEEMEDQVILIAYSDGQARKLAKLAPEMMISLTIKSPSHLKELTEMGIATNKMAAWTGLDPVNSDLLATLNKKDITVLAMRNPQNQNSAIADADLIVSDYAMDSSPILGAFDKPAFEACLSKK